MIRDNPTFARLPSILAQIPLTRAGLPILLGIFRPIEARCKEIQSVVGCAGGRVAGLAALERRNASLGLHRGTGTPRRRPPPPLLPFSLMPAQAVHATARSATGRRRAGGRRSGR